METFDAALMRHQPMDGIAVTDPPDTLYQPPPAEPAALTFFVPGKPQTAGSKTSVPVVKEGVVVARNVVESGTTGKAGAASRERKKTWRQDIRDAARSAGGRLAEPGAALEVRFVFVVKRPSDQLRTGRHAGVVKDWAVGRRPVKRPDSVKMARAAEDALTEVLWPDDSQIVGHRLDKAFGDQVGLDARAEGLIVVVREARPYGGPRVAAGGGRAV